MNNHAAAVFVITGLTASWAYLIWWIVTTPQRRKPYCELCDIEGPHEPESIPYAGLDAHRTFHQLGRELMKPFERLIDWIENKLTRKPR